MSDRMTRAGADSLTAQIKSHLDAIRTRILDLESIGAYVEAAEAQTQLESMLAFFGGAL